MYLEARREGTCMYMYIYMYVHIHTCMYIIRTQMSLYENENPSQWIPFPRRPPFLPARKPKYTSSLNLEDCPAALSCLDVHP